MADSSRIDDLRRRVQRDPSSIAFAQLAEECRRAGHYEEAVDTCRAGLEIHPGYLSARVTLGRALIELGQLDEGETELATVLQSAPENLAAIRGLAEIHHRRGDLAKALAQYRAALALAPNDPDLEQTVAELSRQVEPPKPPAADGLTLQHMQAELLKRARKPDGPAVAAPADRPAAAAPADRPAPPQPSTEARPSRHENLPDATPAPVSPPLPPEEAAIDGAFSPPGATTAPAGGTLTAGADDRAAREVAALEQLLDAIHVARANRPS
jgi:tetratricopeptide (TPR) repeat protein